MGGGYTLNMASVEAAPEPQSPQVGVAMQLQSGSCRGYASSTRGAACHCLPSHWGDVCCSRCCSTLPTVRSAPLMGRGSGLSSFRRARQVSERERSTACVGYLPASQQEGFSAAEVVCWHIPRLAGTNSQQRWAPPALAAAAGIGAAAPRAPQTPAGTCAHAALHCCQQSDSGSACCCHLAHPGRQVQRLPLPDCRTLPCMRCCVTACSRSGRPLCALLSG